MELTPDQHAALSNLIENRDVLAWTPGPVLRELVDLRLACVRPSDGLIVATRLGEQTFRESAPAERGVSKDASRR